VKVSAEVAKSRGKNDTKFVLNAGGNAQQERGEGGRKPHDEIKDV
jgi:hypothetical protein